MRAVWRPDRVLAIVARNLFVEDSYFLRRDFDDSDLPRHILVIGCVRVKGDARAVRRQVWARTLRNLFRVCSIDIRDPDGCSSLEGELLWSGFRANG